MGRVIIAPGKYVQGAGEMANLGAHVAKLGKKVLIVISSSGRKRNAEILEASFEAANVEFLYEDFNGECSRNEIARLVKIVKDNGIDVVVGVGGGKILDTSKAVAYENSIPVAIVPTIASTDAPCSALAVVYSDEGVFEDYYWLPANPNLVLVDTDVIVKAPARLLVSGMGDALEIIEKAK